MAVKLLAAGSSYTVATSADDGVTWDYGTFPSIAGYSVADGGPVWLPAAGGPVLVATAALKFPTDAASDIAAYSASGLAWSTATLPSVQKWSNPVWAGTRYVTVGQTSAAYSVDGVAWVEVPLGFTLPMTALYERPKIAALGANIVVTAYDEALTPAGSRRVATSTDSGATWALQADTLVGGVYRMLPRVSDILIIYKDPIKSVSVTFPYLMSAPIDTGQGGAAGGVAANSTRTVSYYSGGVLYSDTVSGAIPIPMTFVDLSVQAVWPTNTMNDMVWTGTRFVAVGFDNEPGFKSNRAQSLDGETWTLMPGLSPPANAAGYQEWNAIILFAPVEYDAGISENIGFTDTLGSGPSKVFAGVTGALQIALSAAGVLGFSAMLTDRIVLFSDGSAAWPVSGSITSELLVSSGGHLGGDQALEAVKLPTQFCTDARTGATSIYTGYDFAQYARSGQNLYGVKADGVYLLRGNSDAGAAINGAVDIGSQTLGTNQYKTIESIYISMDTDANVFVIVSTDGNERTYQVTKCGPVLRAILAKGARGREWGIKVDITDATFADIDSIEFMAGVSTRRLVR